MGNYYQNTVTAKFLYNVTKMCGPHRHVCA